MHTYPPEDWEPPEHFVHEISLVPCYEFRIRTMIAVCEFDETFNSYQQKFQHIIGIIDFIRSDSLLKELARSLLCIGDFLNHVRLNQIFPSYIRTNLFSSGLPCWKCFWLSIEYPQSTSKSSFE